MPKSINYNRTDVSIAKSSARFSEGPKPNTRFYIEQRRPSFLKSAILLEQVYHTTRISQDQFKTSRGQFLRGKG